MRYPILLAFFFIGASGIGPVFGTVFPVEASGEGSYPTIQAAINFASDGDTVMLGIGIYRGEGNRDIDLQGKAITVQSEFGAATCVIDCQGSETENHRGFFINSGEGAGTIIDGLTIRNGYQSGGGIGGNGGGIYARITSPTIRNCIFENNYAASGPALRVQSSDSAVSNCIFRNNSGAWNGAVSIYENSPIFENCTFLQNASENDAAGIHSQASSVIFRQCRFESNEAAMLGGGLYFNGGSPTLEGCEVLINAGQQGGGILAVNSAVLSLVGCFLGQNRAAGAGPALYIENSSLQMNRCLVQGNIGEANGGAVFAYSSTITLWNSEFSGNASQFGGALFGNGATYTVGQCTVAGNQALYSGGGMYLRNGSTADISGCIFWNNRNLGGNPGDQIFAEEAGTTAQIGTSDVQEGQAGTHAENEGAITWNAGNIESDPRFVCEGSWDDNETANTLGDDVWQIGNYQIMPGSPAMDMIFVIPPEAGDADVIGNPRVRNGAMDLGAYESYFTDTVDCTKMVLKAGKVRPAEAETAGDSLAVTGTFQASQERFESAEACTIQAGTWAQTVLREDFTGGGSKPVYSYKGKAPGLTSLKVDFGKGTFQAAAKNIDLTGTAAPAPVVLSFGDYYGYDAVEDGAALDVLNGKKMVPIQFMVGSENTLRITKVKGTQDAFGHIKSLSLQGEIAMAQPVDLTEKDVTLHWGAETVTVLAGEFTEKKEGVYEYSYKLTIAPKTSTKTIFDFNKCTFKIDIKNTDVPWQASPVAVRLQLGDGFDETVTGVSF